MTTLTATPLRITFKGQVSGFNSSQCAHSLERQGVLPEKFVLETLNNPGLEFEGDADQVEKALQMFAEDKAIKISRDDATRFTVEFE